MFGLLQHYINGCITSHIKTKWQVGDEVEWRGPHGMFLHSPNKVKCKLSFIYFSSMLIILLHWKGF